MSAYIRKSDGTLETAIPEPYWYRPWWSLFRYRPGCYGCNTAFKSRELFEDHYIKCHAFTEATDEPQD